MIKFAAHTVHMKEDNRRYDLKVRCVGDYNRYIGVPTVNPSVSVVHYDEIGQIRHSRTLWGVYGLFLLDDTDELLGYGSGGYDYHCGSLVCVAPSQIGGASDDGTTFRRKGWALLFHPSFFHGTDFEKSLLKYEFFHYHVNEALPMTENDREKFVCLLSMLKEEISGSNAEAVVRKLIELILSYCQLFFNRHFNLPASKSSHIVSRFEEILNDYYTNSEPLISGQPTVRECAERLCIAPNYLGDLIRQETGESAIRFIGKFIVNRAKSMLMEGHSIAETAYALGFEYPAHLTRLFNRIEGMAPSKFLKGHQRQ